MGPFGNVLFGSLQRHMYSIIVCTSPPGVVVGNISVITMMQTLQRTLFHRGSPCMGQLRSYHCTLYRTMTDMNPAASAGEASQYRSIVLAPSKTADRTKYERYTRNQEVTPSTLIRKTILDNGNEFITPNTLFKEVKKHGDAFKSKRHFKRVLTPMRLGNQVC